MKMFESCISAGVVWSSDMEGDAQKMSWKVILNRQSRKLSNCTKFQIFSWMTSNSSRKNSNQSENWEKFAHKSYFKCLYLARIGRPDIPWSVNKLARWVTKWTQACDRRLARLISYIHYTNDFRQYCHVGETRHSIADWVCFKTQTLLEILRTQNRLEEVSCVSLEAEHLSWSVGCARCQHQCLTVLHSMKLFLWMLVCEWMESLLSIYGLWWSKYYILQTTPIKQWEITVGQKVDDQVPRSRARSELQSTNTKLNRHGNRDFEELSQVDHVVTNEKSSQFEDHVVKSRSCDDRRTFFSVQSPAVHFWKQRSCDQDHHQRQRSDDETRVHRAVWDWLSDKSTWTPKSKSNMLTPRTNSLTCWPRVVLHVMGGVIFLVWLTLWIFLCSVAQCVWFRKAWTKGNPLFRSGCFQYLWESAAGFGVCRWRQNTITGRGTEHIRITNFCWRNWKITRMG